MYTKIMVPVDLAHVEQLEKALVTAADLSKHYGASVSYVSVSAATPGPLAHNPGEFESKLAAFAKQQAAAQGIDRVDSRAFISHDPTVDLDSTLMKAIAETGADLVVVASHLPGYPEYLFASNAGYLAMHSSVSVMVVR